MPGDELTILLILSFGLVLTANVRDGAFFPLCYE